GQGDPRGQDQGGVVCPFAARVADKEASRSLLPERLERQDRARVLDARDGLHLLVDEVPDIGVGIDVELHEEVEVASSGIDLGGDLGVGEPVGHVVGLAQVAFDLHEEGNHLRLLPAAPASRQSSKNPSFWQGVACDWPIEYDRQGGSNMPAPQVDLRLYALVDPERAGGHGLPELAWNVAPGGATLVQLRDKHGATRAMVEEARAIRENLVPMRVPFLINDRVDVALAADAEADGVNVGQDDMAVEDARRLLGPGAIIGLSIKTVEQAEAAPVDLLDYAAIGGVYVTTSKDNPDAPVGVDGLARIAQVLRRRRAELPICAIAGIDASNAAATIKAGADGVAVISALSLAESTPDAARELRAIIDKALAERKGE